MAEQLELSDELNGFFEGVVLNERIKNALIRNRWTKDGLNTIKSLGEAISIFCNGPHSIHPGEAAIIWASITKQKEKKMKKGQPGQSLDTSPVFRDVDYNNNQFHYLGAEQKRTTQKKADFMRRYLATHNDGCFTIVRKNLLCTFAHGTHGDKDTKGAGWKVGQKITDIRLFDGSCIDCEVKKVDSVLDCIWLKPSKDITIIDDIQIDLPFYNQEVVVLGLSGVNQIRHQELENIPNDHVRISYDICNVSCISLDEFNRLKTNKKSSPGESGGPIFDYWDGHLIGMMVGSESYPGEIKEDTGCVNQRASTQRDDSTILVTNFVKSVISLAESAGYGGKGSFISSYILATACNNP